MAAKWLDAPPNQVVVLTGWCLSNVQGKPQVCSARDAKDLRQRPLSSVPSRRAKWQGCLWVLSWYGHLVGTQ